MSNGEQPRAPSAQSFRRFAFIFVGISLVTTAIVIWAVGGPGPILDAFASFDARFLPLLIGALALEAGCDVWRYQSTARALAVRLGVRLGVRITFANLFFAYLTPGGGFGAPVVTFMLYKSGVDLPRSIAISLIKPFLSLFVLIPGLSAMTLVGGQDFVSATALKVVIVGTGGLAWFAISIIIVSAIWPQLASRIIERPLRWLGARAWLRKRFADRIDGVVEGVHRTIEAFGLFTRNGWHRMVLAMLAAIADVVAMCAVAVVLLHGFGAEGTPVQLWGLSLLYVAVISISPTPGGSGIAEGSGMAIFDGVFATSQQAAAFVILWRLLTCYLPLVIGATMFARFLQSNSQDEIQDLT